MNERGTDKDKASDESPGRITEDELEANYEDEFDDSGVDWPVFMIRASAIITFGATLIVSIDLSRNQDVDWVSVMRLAVLPFIGGMLLVAAAELIDRSPD